jgi:hypothetical protein
MQSSNFVVIYVLSAAAPVIIIHQVLKIKMEETGTYRYTH